MEQTINGEFITITINAETIRQMVANRMAIWHTAGSTTVYLAATSAVADDAIICNAQDALWAAGVESVTELGDTGATLQAWI